jgi:hypothetical protein
MVVFVLVSFFVCAARASKLLVKNGAKTERYVTKGNCIPVGHRRHAAAPRKRQLSVSTIRKPMHFSIYNPSALCHAPVVI